MAKFKKATSKNLRQVFDAILKQCEEDPIDAKIYAKEINDMLDRLKSEDFFGTEGQCDPRGDHRD